MFRDVINAYFVLFQSQRLFEIFLQGHQITLAVLEVRQFPVSSALDLRVYAQVV